MLNRRTIGLLSVAALATPAWPSRAQVVQADEAGRARFAESLVGEGRKTSRHAVTIRGRRVDYIATVSGTRTTDKTGAPDAVFVAVSYSKVGGAADRPVLFAWNGGPSGPSTGVHFSALGPRIRATDSEGKTVNPVRLVENAQSVLDRADLVMVDPVGTGLSQPLGEKRLSDFYSLETDADSIARFIEAWLKDNGRTGSPVFLLGESYGTMRLPITANLLQARGAPVAGQVYIAPALNGQTIWESPSHLEPYFFYFPSYALIANYHKRAPRPRTDIHALWKEAGDFALGEYMTALFAWPEVSDDQKASVLDRLYQFTGVSRETWAQNDIRLGTLEFAREVLKEQGLVTSLSDGRQALSLEALSKMRPPAADSAEETYVDVYLRTDLGVSGAPRYREFAPGSEDWNYLDHGLRDRAPRVPSYQDFLVDIAAAMKTNPKMRVMQNAGFYDEQCNAFPARWALERMRIPAGLRGNVKIYEYESGHAVFMNAPAEFMRFTQNLGAFLDNA